MLSRGRVARSVALALTGLTLGLSACGGSASTDPTAVQENLVAVADALDRCTAKSGDARKCTSEDALGDLPGSVELGGGDGQVKINASKPTRYQLTSSVDGDTQFAILAQPVGARKRVCSPAGKSGCPKQGAW